MSTDIVSKYDYKEISEELGIPYDDFIQFVNHQHPSQLNIINIRDIPMTEAVNKYLNSILEKVPDTRSMETYNTYRSFLMNLLDFLNDNYSGLSLMNLNETHLDQYLRTCQPRNGNNSLSPYTINTYTSILRDLISYCYFNELIGKDFRKRFEWARAFLLPRYLPDEHMILLLKNSVQLINGYRSYAMLSVLVGTGLRVSELVNLKIFDINLIDKVIKVRKGKGKKDRFVPLYPEVETIILDYLNITGYKSVDTNHGGYLFAKDYGIIRKNKLTKAAVQKMFNRLCKKIGFVERYTVHSLRHTFAVRCIKAGMSMAYLSQVLGHTNPKTTFIYTQLLNTDLGQELTEKFPIDFSLLLLRLVGGVD